MSAIKDGRYPIMLDKERHLLISLNVIDAIQDKFGSYTEIDKHLKGKDMIKNLRWLLTLAINEGKSEAEEDLTEMQIGRMIHTGNMGEITSAIYKAFGLAVNGDRQADEAETQTFPKADKEIR